MGLLVECPKCRRRVSLKKDSCPGCGLSGLKKRPGKVYWIEYYDFDGKRRRERIGSSKEAAEARLAEVKKLKAEKRFIPGKFQGVIRLGDFYLKHYLPYCEKHNRPRWVKRKRDVWRLYFAPFFGPETRLKDITPSRIESYKQWRLSQGARGPTVNRELAILKNAYSMAEKWGFVDSNPVKRVKFFEENRDRWYFLSKEEARRLLDNLPFETRPIFEFLLATGLRLSNVLRLRWDQVDLRAGLLRVEGSETKNRKELILPLSKWALEVLKRQPRHIKSPYVFCRPDGKPYSYIYQGFKNALVRAELPSHIRIHDLRHTFASWAIEAGVDIRTLKDLLGHATLTMVLRYSHLSLEHKRQAVNRVNLADTDEGSITQREEAS